MDNYPQHTIYGKNSSNYDSLNKSLEMILATSSSTSVLKKYFSWQSLRALCRCHSFICLLIISIFYLHAVTHGEYGPTYKRWMFRGEGGGPVS